MYVSMEGEGLCVPKHLQNNILHVLYGAIIKHRKIVFLFMLDVCVIG